MKSRVYWLSVGEREQAEGEPGECGIIRQGKIKKEWGAGEWTSLMNDSIEKCVLDFNVAGDLSRSYFIPDTDSVLSTCVTCVRACWVTSVVSDSANLTDCRSPGSSVHGILQARILEWVVVFLLQGIFPIQGSKPHPYVLLAGRFFIIWVSWESLCEIGKVS